MNNLKKVLIVIALFAISACTSTPVKVDVENDLAPTGMGLDYRDFSEAAEKMVESMLISGAIDHPDGSRFVLAISRITNDTMQRIDTDQLVKKIISAYKDIENLNE